MADTPNTGVDPGNPNVVEQYSPMVNYIPYNAREVHPYDPTSSSGYIDAFTGVMNEATLLDLRNRAVYNEDAITYSPIADSGTGVLFPGAVKSKTVVESAIRVRPTTFKGKQQLDLSEADADVHFNRQINPNGWKDSKRVWYKNKGGLPFVGYQNPNYFNAYTDIIPTQNVQNLSHAQLTEAMRSMEIGNFSHDKYLQHLGSMLQSDAVPEAASANIEQVIQSDGRGVNSDPRLMEDMAEQYETYFNKAKRIQVADATNDPRFVTAAPGMQLQAEQQAFAAKQESQFSKISEFGGFGSSYTRPERFHT